jgi:hypothetical protein
MSPFFILMNENNFEITPYHIHKACPDFSGNLFKI